MSYSDSPSHRLRHVELREVELESQQPYLPTNHPPTPKSSSPKNPKEEESRIVDRCPDTLCQTALYLIFNLYIIKSPSIS